MANALTLSEFETIDGLNSRLLYMGDFETCADPREYVRTENRLFAACIDAVGHAEASSFRSTMECAATILAGCLCGTITVFDGEAA